MDGNISQCAPTHDHSFVSFLPDGYVPPSHKKTYWAALRGFGSRHYELSVCRPSEDFSSGRDFSLTRRVKVRSAAEIEQAAEDSLKRSVRRSRQRVRWLVKCIGADHMLTFTYRENMQDCARLKSDLRECVRLIRTRYPAFQYVAVREIQDRGALHLHMAVKGKQPIKWILHCWLKSIGQDHKELTEWFVGGVPLLDKSLGAVNVRAPKKYWGGRGSEWKPDRLSGYLTKYIHKDFETSARGAKRYWHTKDIEPIKCVKFWLGANSFVDALREARDVVSRQGVVEMKMWGDDDIGNIWISATAPPAHDGRFLEPFPF